MIKTFIGGIAVGLANIIPGVSGGTMMVILGLFNRVMECIDGLFSKNNDHRKEDFIFLCILGAGAIVGLVVFAKVLEFCFANYETQTMFAFVGMVAFSIPSIVKKEMSNDKFSLIPFMVGAFIIFGLMYLAPEQKDVVFTTFPDISVVYLLLMIVIGVIGGGAMFVPGVSGSMVLLIIGQYYLFKSLIANVTTFQINVLIPLIFVGCGVIIGIVLSSKICNYFLRTHHSGMMNFILGLVVASSIVLIPINASYDILTIITSAICLIGGGLIVLSMERLS